MAKKNLSKIHESRGDRILEMFTSVILVLILIIIAYPLIYVVSCSFSSSEALKTAQVVLWPVNFTLKGYKFAMQYSDLWLGFRNTIMYTVLGVSLTMFLQILMAYPISKNDYQGKSVILKLMLVAMMVNAGMIPTFLLKNELGLNNNVGAIVLAAVINIHNTFMLRNAFKHSIPGDLFDAAKIDGANDFQALVKIAIPLAKATISVLVLYSAVGCWNDYFNALVYLTNRRDLWPLQLFLRNILRAGDVISEGSSSTLNVSADDGGLESLRYCVIVISTIPVLVMYLVVQKFFEKGVMVGSVKG